MFGYKSNANSEGKKRDSEQRGEYLGVIEMGNPKIENITHRTSQFVNFTHSLQTVNREASDLWS